MFFVLPARLNAVRTGVTSIGFSIEHRCVTPFYRIPLGNFFLSVSLTAEKKRKGVFAELSLRNLCSLFSLRLKYLKMEITKIILLCKKQNLYIAKLPVQTQA